MKAQDNGQNDRHGRKSTELDMYVFMAPAVHSGPTFTQQTYSVDIQENLEPGSRVLITSTTSADSEYFVTSTTPSGSLVQYRSVDIDRITGEITTTRVLDRESGVTQFVVEVYAMDNSGRNPTARNTRVCHCNI